MPDFSSLLANPILPAKVKAPSTNLFINELPCQAFPIAGDSNIKNDQKVVSKPAKPVPVSITVTAKSSAHSLL